MAEIFETKQMTERVILVGVSCHDNDDTEQSLEELCELASTAGAETVGRMIQNREAPHPGTYLGKGKIEELNSLIDVEYPKKINELDEARKEMKAVEEKYLNETNVSTDEEIQNALQIESYDIERLWAKVGIHANNEGVNLKLVLNASSSGSNETRDLAFTVDGSYIGITNFIYALEDDEELDFRIYNFKMLPYQNDILRAIFNVRDVRITQNSLNEALGNTTQQNTAQENTEAKNDNPVAE